MDIASLPESAGIYAIINTLNGRRYVGQASNIRSRVKQHLHDLRRGREATNKERLLQRAWDEVGENAFAVEVLVLVHNNKAETQYHVRPDNLSLAEHYFINERAEYNADRAIVRAEFHELVQSQEWRVLLSDVIPGREPHDVASTEGAERSYDYMVAERKTQHHPVIVTARDEREAKDRARAVDSTLRNLGSNISCWRLSALALREAVSNGARDCRESENA